MSLLTHSTPSILWRGLIKQAESRCAISLENKLESYLVELLIRYTNKPEVVKQILAKAFLDALQMQAHQRKVSLQNVGDQCLLYAGLFPHFVERRNLKLSYFVDLGRSAYASVSYQTNDLFNLLAVQFVVLMDVLQSLRLNSELLPLEAYNQWEELGSQRAYNILKTYSKGIPIKKTD